MVTLAYDVLSLELPSPEHGNTQDLAPTRINRKTRGGKREVYKDSIWPINKILKQYFTGISEADKEYFLTLVESAIGQPITYTDYESTVWSGFITEHNTSEDIRGCGFSIDFTLEIE